MSRRLVPALFAFVAVLPALPAGAARARPPLCEAGSFVVAEDASPLVPGGSSAPDRVVLGTDGTLAIESGCPAVAAKQKGSGRGNTLSAKWTAKSGACIGLPSASLKASFDADCTTLTGTFKSKGTTRAFTATRAAETLGAPDLAPALDPARNTTKTLGPAGGDVFARAADGTRFRLVVPPGALAAEVAITLTPATSLGGLPLDGGFLAAVDLAPSGLSFAVPATLYVVPEGGVPASGTAGFGWSGAANTFAVSPAWRDAAGRWLALEIEHFSGYGIGIPGPSQLDALLVSLLALEADQAEIEGVLLACLQDPAAPCTEPDLENVLVEWYDSIVAPRLAAAGGASVTAVIAAHQALRTWVTAVEYTPFDALPGTLAARREQGLASDLANLALAFDAYTEPTCSGATTDWKDWLRVPEELKTRAAQLHEQNPDYLLTFALGPAEYCARFLIADLSFPANVAATTTELPLSFVTYLVEFAKPLAPIAARVELSYSEGASGPAEVTTGADGTLDQPILVERTPGSPLFVLVDLAGVELELERPDVLSHATSVRAGALAFEANLGPLASPILAPGSTSTHCLVTALAGAENQTVQLDLDGPGDLSSESTSLAFDPSDGALRGCVDYTAPDGPVAKGEIVELHATLAFAGETYEDVLALHPRWIEITLQADLGAGLQDVTNAIEWIPDTGPFALAATVTGPGETVDDPPGAIEGAALDADAQDALLSLTGTGGTDPLALVSDAAGQAGFALTGDDAETTHAVELRHDPQGSSEAAGVVLKRLPPAMALSLPSTVTPGTPVAFEVSATEGPNPAPGYHVELTATGGSVGASTGTTNQDGQFATSATLAPGQTLLTITATLRAEPGGEVLDVATAQASGEPVGSVVFVSRDGVYKVGCTAAGMFGTPQADEMLHSLEVDDWNPTSPDCAASFSSPGSASASSSGSGSLLLELGIDGSGGLERVRADIEGAGQESTSEGVNASGYGWGEINVVFDVVGASVPYHFEASADADGDENATGFGWVQLGSYLGSFPGAPDYGCVDAYSYDDLGPVCEGAGGLPLQSGVLPPGRYRLHARAEASVSSSDVSGSVSAEAHVELRLGAAAAP
jgi:hypothetical protein